MNVTLWFDGYTESELQRDLKTIETDVQEYGVGYDIDEKLLVDSETVRKLANLAVTMRELDYSPRDIWTTLREAALRQDVSESEEETVIDFAIRQADVNGLRKADEK